jgi:DNA-binding transcriptional LysR family regulator
MKALHITLSQMEMLVAIAEAGSFSEAATCIHLTQSALSHAITKLEHDLGIQLLLRGRKGVSLTPVGLEVLKHARGVLAQAYALEAVADQEREALRGRLRIGHVHSLNSRLMAGMLTLFQQQYPDVDVLLFEATGEEIADWVRHDLVDLGLVLHPSPGIESRLLVHDEIKLLVPAQHWLSEHQSVSLQELQAETMLLPGSQCDVVDLVFLPTGFTPRQMHAVTDIRAMLLMVQEGLGISFNAQLGLPPDRSGIRAISLDPPIYTQFGLGYRAGKAPSLLSNKFIQVAEYWALGQGRLALAPSS